MYEKLSCLVHNNFKHCVHLTAIYEPHNSPIHYDNFPADCTHNTADLFLQYYTLINFLCHANNNSLLSSWLNSNRRSQ